MSMTATLTTRIDANLINDLDIQTATSLLAYSKVANLTTGTGDGQVDQMYTIQSTIAGSGNTTVDLSLPLVNPVGQSIKFTKVKAILLFSAAANGGDIIFGPNSVEGFIDFFNAAADRVKLPPGGVFMITSPVGGEDVTENTDDKLYIGNLHTATITYDLVVIGVATVI